eukprot:XP_001708108.1 Hypothetical protein GL50803_37097 [Giardia lamblia ATCC 50803]
MLAASNFLVPSDADLDNLSEPARSAKVKTEDRVVPFTRSF